MAITFGGLATGMDTDGIVSALMNIERAPLERLENDKNYFTNRQAAFTDLENKLKDFLTKAETIDTATELRTPTLTSGSDDYFQATGTSTAAIGSYQVEVIDLAQLQKDVSAGYASKTSSTFGTGTISLTVDGTPNNITIDGTNNSLEGIAQAINDANTGATATVINDGTASPYRLVISGDTVSDTFTLDASGLTGGTDANPSMTNTQSAQQAHIQVDNIDIYGDTNTIKDAISGVTLELLKVDAAVSTTLGVATDEDATKQLIQEFVDGYNGVVNYIASQADADWGNDSAFRMVKRKMQTLLTTSQVGGSSSFTTFSELGFETQRDGTITVNSTTMEEALDDDFAGVLTLLTGETGVEGLLTGFTDYLDDATDVTDGVAASRKEGTDNNIRRIDSRISMMEARLEAREKTLRARFTAMEELVSSMNTQSNFLSQQMSNLNSMNKR